MNSTNNAPLPRLWTDWGTSFQHRDTAVEAAHLEIGRLQNTNTLLRQLLDEATSRISDLAQYHGKAATIIASLRGQNPSLMKHERLEHPPTKGAGISNLGALR